MYIENFHHCTRLTDLRHGPGIRKAAPSAAVALLLLCSLGNAHADNPGGFMESDETAVVRPAPTPAQIQAFMPSRGSFTFPAPYNTQGARITNSSDCAGGQDCVDYVGYPYWRNINDHVGSDTMYIFLGLDRARGGPGPTLFSYSKSSGQVTKVGPLFDPSSDLNNYTGEGWYFSASMPTKMYIPYGSKLLRYDVLAHSFETVFDSTSQYPGTVIHQANSSDDDDVHSATLESASSTNPIACIAYKASTRHFYYFPVDSSFDECQIDKSGRYLEIKEKLPIDPCASCDEDDVIEDLQAGTQTVLLDQNGAGGHSDLGFGFMVAADNWNLNANAWRLWDLAMAPVNGLALGINNLLQGSLVYHNLTWDSFAPMDVSYENASANTPISQQYACGSSANRANTPHANEIVCFMLNSATALRSEGVLVVAPVMTDLDASGGGDLDYSKEPKGNLDITGQYFIWTSNCGGNRLDAFIVKVPSQVLTGSVPPVSPPPPGGGPSPAVAITSPQNGAELSGNVTVAANASDSAGIASVTLELDSGAKQVTLDTPPYSVSWDTSSVTPGTHMLTAVAVDEDGNRSTSPPVTVTVSGSSSRRPGGPPDPGTSSGSPSSGGGSGAIALWPIAFLWLLRRRRRHPQVMREPSRTCRCDDNNL